MADPTLIATPKATNANSYITRADAQTYFNGRIDADDWEDADNADKDRSLITATNRLEQEEYEGSTTTTTQRLKHPRSGLINPQGNQYDDDLIARPVEEATCELALAILNGSWVPSDTGLEAYNEAIVGPLEVVMNRGYTATKLPQMVLNILDDVRIGSFGLNIPVKRG